MTLAPGNYTLNKVMIDQSEQQTLLAEMLHK